MIKLTKIYSLIIFFIIIIQLFNSLFRTNELLNFLTFFDDFLMFFMLVSLFFLKKNNTILGKPLLIFFLICCFSAILNEVKFDVFFVQLRSYLLPFSIYFIIIYLPFRIVDINNFLRKFLWISIIVVLTGYLEFFLDKTIFITKNRFGEDLAFDDGISRVFSVIGNPIDFSNFLLVMISLSAPMILINKKVNNLKRYYFLILLFVFALFLSNSRGPILALLISFLLLFMFSKKISSSKKIKIIISSIIIVVSVGSIFISRLLEENTLSMDSGYRIVWFFKSLEIISDYPFFGVGPGKFGGWVSINFNESEIYQLYNISTDGISSIDMFYPHLFAETGIIGGIAYLFLYLKPFYFFKKFINSNNDQIALVSTTMFLLVSNLLLTAMTSISLETQLILVLYAVVLGFSEKILKLKQFEYNTSLSNQSI